MTWKIDCLVPRQTFIFSKSQILKNIENKLFRTQIRTRSTSPERLRNQTITKHFYEIHMSGVTSKISKAALKARILSNRTSPKSLKKLYNQKAKIKLLALINEL